MMTWEPLGNMRKYDMEKRKGTKSFLKKTPGGCHRFHRKIIIIKKKNPEIPCA